MTANTAEMTDAEFVDHVVEMVRETTPPKVVYVETFALPHGLSPAQQACEHDWDILRQKCSKCWVTEELLQREGAARE